MPPCPWQRFSCLAENVPSPAKRKCQRCVLLIGQSVSLSAQGPLKNLKVLPTISDDGQKV